jgi:integrase
MDMGLSLVFTSDGFTVDGISYAGIPVFVETDTMRVQYLPTEWFIHLAVDRGSTRSPLTWKNYAYRLLSWLRFCIGHHWNWASPEERHLAHYRNMIERQAPKLKRVTIAKTMLVLCRFYEWAHHSGHVSLLPVTLELVRGYQKRRGLLAHLPRNDVTARHVLVPRASRSTTIPRYFTKTEQLKFFPFLSERDVLIVMWALYTGAREHEICALQTGQIPQQSAYQARRFYPIPLAVSKGSVGGDLQVPTWLLDETYRYITFFDRRTVARTARAQGKHVPDNIFLGRYGSAIKPNSVWKNFKKALKAAGLQGRFHDLRHTFAINMLDRLTLVAETPEAKIRSPLVSLKHLMRHESLDSLEIYLTSRELYLADIYSDPWDVPEAFLDE